MLPGDVGPSLPQVAGGVGPIAGALTGPVSAPPATPAEEEQNRGLWTQFITKVRSDPAFRMAVQQTAVGMMRSPQMGQNSFDVLGGALQGGMLTLDQLRERERTQRIDDAERRRKAGLEERQTKTQEVVAGTGVARETRESKAQDTGVSQWLAQYQLEQQKLNEAIRSNKSQEDIARLRAQAEATRAKAYSEGRAGKTAAEIQKIDMLTQNYMQKYGMNEVEAQALAIEYLQETGKGKAPGDRIRAAVDARMRSYQGSLESLDKPVDAEMIRQWTQEAIQMDKETEDAINPRVTPAPGGAGSSAGPQFTAKAPFASSADFAAAPNVPAPAAQPPGSVVPAQRPDPAIAAEVAAAIRARKDPAAIRQRLVERGLDPALYGL